MQRLTAQVTERQTGCICDPLAPSTDPIENCSFNDKKEKNRMGYFLNIKKKHFQLF